jgi:hypothetical protein
LPPPAGRHTPTHCSSSITDRTYYLNMTSVPYYVPIGCRSDIVRLLGANGDDVKDRAVFEFKVNLEMVLAKQVDTKMNFRS